MSYLVIKNLNVEKANALPAWWVGGAPSMIGLYGFVHNMERQTGGHVKKFGLVVHELNVHGTNLHNESQIVGLSFDRSVDLPKATSPLLSHKRALKASQKNPGGQPIQPSAVMDMRVSIVLETDDMNVRKLKKTLGHSRIVGGYIKNNDYEIVDVNSSSDIPKEIRNGFAVVDAKQLLHEDDKLESALVISSMRGIPNRYFLTCNGYQSISPIAERHGARSDKHTYVEPMVGLNEYVNVRTCKEAKKEFPMWEYQCDLESGTFLVSGEHQYMQG